jgi:uncharacterized membrane protein YccC
VIGAFVIFQGTGNTEEQVGKALSRITGTLAGIVVGSALVDLIGPHAAWMIVVILASVLLGLYLQRASYAFLVIGITVTVSQLYTELGNFSRALLVQRLEETAIGTAVAAAVVVAVLPCTPPGSPGSRCAAISPPWRACSGTRTQHSAVPRTPPCCKTIPRP